MTDPPDTRPCPIAGCKGTMRIVRKTGRPLYECPLCKAAMLVPRPR